MQELANREAKMVMLRDVHADIEQDILNPQRENITHDIAQVVALENHG